MDVRCEKCQTEYELDESRLKPGGVTVKCTNCGHMFKIRKRANTNVGVPSQGSDGRARAPSKPGPGPAAPRAESAPVDRLNDLASGPNSERQWLVRLENGETKTCRELALLQQWIVAGVVSRESLISRTGKTWKRLGDIAELSQYFVIADEARTQRSVKPTGKAAGPMAATMLGVGRPGGVDDDEETRSTGAYRTRTPTPPPPPMQPLPQPPPAPLKPVQQSAPKASPVAETELAPSGPYAQASVADEAPTTRRSPTPAVPMPRLRGLSQVDRQTAMWANNEVKASESM